MQWLTRFSLKNPLAIVLLSMLVAFGGAVSFLLINIESEPQAKLGMLTISTSYPNASAEDVLEDVTKPLEKTVAAASGVKEYISASEENHSLLTVSIEGTADIERVRTELENNLASVKLPAGAGRPKVKISAVGSEPMYFLAISNRDLVRTDKAFHELVEDTLVEQLEKISGVNEVEVIGTKKEEVRIRPKAEALLHYGMSASGLIQALSDQHLASSVGSVSDQGTDYLVRVSNEYENLDQIKQTWLSVAGAGKAGQGLIQLGEVADVSWNQTRQSVSRLNGKPAVAVQISKTADGNIVGISEEIHRKLDEYRRQYPDLQFEIISDRSDFVKDSIGGMAREGVMGILMASIAIFLFLRHVKSTLIVLVSIPLSILISVMLMKANGITINLMSLFGMAVAIGRIVDDSIVVIENIFRHAQTKRADQQTIIGAVREVAGAITSSTLTTAAVFLPIAFVSGILGDFFKPFAVAVVCSLAASLLVSVTVVPLLASVMMRQGLKNVPRNGHAATEGRLFRIYRHSLHWAFAHKGMTALLTLALFVGSVGLAANLPSGFLPELNMNLLYVKVKMPTGTALEATSARVGTIEAALLQEQDVQYVQSKIGAGSGEVKLSHVADLTIKLKQGTDEDKALERVRNSVEPLIPAGAQVSYSKPAAGGQGGYQLVLTGRDFLALKTAAELIEQKLKENPLLANIKDNVSDQKRQLSIKVDRDRAAMWKLTPRQVSAEIAAAIGTTHLKPITLNGKQYDLVVGTGELATLEQMPALWMQAPGGQQVSLGEIAALEQESVPPQFLRKNGKAYIQITADILSADKGGVAQRQTLALQQLELPAGVSMSSEGLQQDMQKGFIDMFAAMGVAVLLVFFVMVLAFGNLLAPVAILLSLPLASIGGLVGLWLVRGVLDMTVLIGFLMLIGIVVTNAIVLIDRVQQLTASGVPVREALVNAGQTRLRPIVMTAAATIAALLPLAFGLSEGSLLSKGLSTVVIGGLLTSTVLTLVVVPVGYDSLHRFVSKLRRQKRDDSASQVVKGEEA